MKGRGKGGGSVDKRGGKKGLLVKKRAAKKVGRKERGITGERSEELLRNTHKTEEKSL